MSRLAHFIPKNQCRCLPVTGRQSFRYVEIITSDTQANNYPHYTKLVDRQALKNLWAEFYFLSKERGHEQ